MYQRFFRKLKKPRANHHLSGAQGANYKTKQLNIDTP